MNALKLMLVLFTLAIFTGCSSKEKENKITEETDYSSKVAIMKEVESKLEKDFNFKFLENAVLATRLFENSGRCNNFVSLLNKYVSLGQEVLANARNPQDYFDNELQVRRNINTAKSVVSGINCEEDLILTKKDNPVLGQEDKADDITSYADIFSSAELELNKVFYYFEEEAAVLELVDTFSEDESLTSELVQQRIDALSLFLSTVDTYDVNATDLHYDKIAIAKKVIQYNEDIIGPVYFEEIAVIINGINIEDIQNEEDRSELERLLNLVNDGINYIKTNRNNILDYRRAHQDDLHQAELNLQDNQTKLESLDAIIKIRLENLAEE